MRRSWFSSSSMAFLVLASAFTMSPAELAASRMTSTGILGSCCSCRVEEEEAKKGRTPMKWHSAPEVLNAHMSLTFSNSPVGVSVGIQTRNTDNFSVRLVDPLQYFITSRYEESKNGDSASRTPWVSSSVRQNPRPTRSLAGMPFTRCGSGMSGCTGLTTLLAEEDVFLGSFSGMLEAS